MKRDFENTNDEIEYYKNYLRAMLRKGNNEKGYLYKYTNNFTYLNNTLNLIKCKRDFYEFRNMVYKRDFDVLNVCNEFEEYIGNSYGN